GVVHQDKKEFILADIPGLIEGAHEGTGLGTRFLGHVERCAVLLHLLDATRPDPAADYRVVRQELDAYGGGLTNKVEILALSKADAVPEDLREELRSELAEQLGKPAELIHFISAVSGIGMTGLLRALAGPVQAARADRAAEAAALERAQFGTPYPDEAEEPLDEEDTGWRP
ncbi:MAG: GTPase, partial [Rhodospirillaceae bacterium]